MPILSSKFKDGRIDFEYPTEADLKLNANKLELVKLTKIEIWYYSEHNFMTGVRVTLSNGQQSPIFKTTGELNGPIVLQLDTSIRAKTLAVRSKEDGVYGLKIDDIYEQELVNWSGDLS